MPHPSEPRFTLTLDTLLIGSLEMPGRSSPADSATESAARQLDAGLPADAVVALPDAALPSVRRSLNTPPSAFPSVPHPLRLLERIDCCAPPLLQHLINTVDYPRLQAMAQMVVDLGTPDECRAWLARRQQQAGEAPQPLPAAAIMQAYKVGSLLYGCSPHPTPLNTRESSSAIAPDGALDWPSSWGDIIDRIMTFCDIICQAIKASEKYEVPEPLQASLLPVLYAWVTDFEFMMGSVTYWLRVCSCFQVVGFRKYPPSFSIPWQPILGLLLTIMAESERQCTCERFACVVRAAGGELQGICSTSALYFDESALEGLWGELAHHFGRDGDTSWMYLALFSSLLPVFRLCDVRTGDAVPGVYSIIRFLFKDACGWQDRREAWLWGTFKVLAQMMVDNEGLLSVDDYAEPIFSSILFLLRLPVGTAQRVVTPSSLQGGGALTCISIFTFSHTEVLSTVSCVVKFLPTNTESPLWNQLRRLLHATSVFVRPSTSGAVTNNVCTVYSCFVSRAHRRVQNQIKYLKRMALAQQMPTSVGSRSTHRPIPPYHVWSRQTINAFVDLMVPVVLPALHIVGGSVESTVGLLLALSPGAVWPRIQSYVEVAIRSANSAGRWSSALSLLSRCVYPLLTSESTSVPFQVFLRTWMPDLATRMDPMTEMGTVTHLFMAVASTGLSLVDLLGSQEAECHTISVFFDRLILFCTHATVRVTPLILDGANVLLSAASDTTYQYVSDKIIKESEVRGQGTHMNALLALVGPRRAADLMLLAQRAAAPVLLSATANDSQTSWAAHLLAACLAGSGRAAVMEHKDVVAKCIRAMVSHVTSARRVNDAVIVYTSMVKVVRDYTCVAGTMAPRGPDHASVTEALEQIDPEMNAHEQLCAEMKLCGSTAAQLTWDEPTEEHLAFLMTVCEGFITEVIEVVENIESVHAGARNPLLGLRGLIPSSSGCGGCQTRGSTPAVAASRYAVEEEASESAEEYTPQHVLLGCCTWLTAIFNINSFLFDAAVPEAVSEEAMPRAKVTVLDQSHAVTWVPHWYLVPHACLPLPLPAGRPPRYTRDELFEFVREHMLRRTVGNVRERLSDTFGPSVIGAGGPLDLTLLETGKPPLGGSNNDKGDPRILRAVISALTALSGLLPQSEKTMYSAQPDSLGMSLELLYFEQVRHVQYFPLCYWRCRANNIVRAHTVVRRTGSLQSSQKLMNLAHLLRFTETNAGVTSTCHRVLHFMTRMLIAPLRRVMLVTHTEALQQLAHRWLIITGGDAARFHLRVTSRAGAGGSASLSLEDEEVASVEPDGTADAVAAATASAVKEEESDGSSRDDDGDDTGGPLPAGPFAARQLLQAGVRLGLSFFSHNRPYRDPDALFWLLQTLMWYPEALVTAPLKRQLLNLRAVVNEVVPQHTDGVHEWLVEQTVALAGRLVMSYPVRAYICARIALCMYHPMSHAVGEGLSVKAVQTIFRLSLSSFSRLQYCAMTLLKACLLNLQAPSPQVRVMLSRNYSVEPPSAEAIAFFQGRYVKLAAAFPRWRLWESSAYFIAPSRGVSLDMCEGPVSAAPWPLTDNFFNDAAPVASPEADLVPRYTYRAALRPSTVCTAVPWCKHLACFTGIAADTMSDAALRRTWLWRALTSLSDLYDSLGLRSHTRQYLLFVYLGNSLEDTVRVVNLYLRVLRLLTQDFLDVEEGGHVVGKESCATLLTPLIDLSVAIMNINTHLADPGLRLRCMEAFMHTALLACRGAYPNDLSSRVLLPAVVDVCRSLTVAEWWYLYDTALSALDHNILAERSSQENSRLLTMLMQLLFSTSPETHGKMVPRLLDGLRKRERCLFLSNTTLMRRLAASVVRFITRLCLSQSSVLPGNSHLTQDVTAFLQETLSRVRFLAVTNGNGTDPPSSDEEQMGADGDSSTALHATPPLTTGQRGVGCHRDLSESWITTPELNLCTTLPTADVVLPIAPTPQMRPTAISAANPVATPVELLSARRQPPIKMTGSPVLSGALPAEGSASPRRFSLDEGYASSSPASLQEEQLARSKFLTILWYQPPVTPQETLMVPFIGFLARALDVEWTGAGEFTDLTAATSTSLAFLRLPKPAVQEVVSFLCDVLEDRLPFGRSRQAKTALARLLGIFFFANTHRIGKFATMRRVADVAVALMGHSDGRLRGEGQQVFLLLTRVASVDQVHAMVQGYRQELWRTPAVEQRASPMVDRSPDSPVPPRRRRVALVLALCAAVTANPGVFPTYLPKLMVRLEPYSRDPNPAIQRAVKTTFEAWWHSHREGWDLEYKRLFTAEQLDSVSVLLKSPAYYV